MSKSPHHGKKKPRMIAGGGGGYGNKLVHTTHCLATVIYRIEAHIHKYILTYVHTHIHIIL